MRQDNKTRGRDTSPGRRLNVCLCLPRLKIGGAEVQVLGLLGHLDRARFRVTLVTFMPGDERMEREAERHVDDHVRLGFRWRRLPVAFARLVRLLRRQRIDVLHCHLALTDVIGRLAGIVAGVPVLLTTEHGKHLWKGRAHLLLERLLSRRTAARICVSRDILEIRRERERTPAEKLVFIPNAVDPAAFEPGRGRAAVMADLGWPPEDDLVLSVGRLVSAKHYPRLVEAAGMLRERRPRTRLLLVGEGPCREEIERRRDELELGDLVSLAGSRTDIPDLLGAADVFVLSSIREGLPVSLLEAMAAGKGIVATRVGGIPDAVADGKSALLVEQDDPAALAGAIARLLDDRELRGRLGEAAKQTIAERYAFDGIGARIGDLYVDLFARRAGAG